MIILIAGARAPEPRPGMADEAVRALSEQK